MRSLNSLKWDPVLKRSVVEECLYGIGNAWREIDVDSVRAHRNGNVRDVGGEDLYWS